MKTEEIVQKLIDMSEENAKLSAALRVLKHKYNAAIAKKESSYFLKVEEVEDILLIAGLLDKEVEVIDLEEKKDAEKLDA